MRKRLCVASVVLLAVFAAPSARADDPDFARTGPYVGIGGTYALNLLESSFDDVLDFNNVDVGDTWGVNARVGYRALRWLSAEVEYEYLNNFNVSSDGVDLADLRAQTISANVRFIAPIKRFQPYLCLGAGATLFTLDDNIVPGLEVDHSSFSGRLGVGFDVYATQNIVLGVGADAVLTTAEVKDPYFDGNTSSSLSYIALHFGIDYRF
jgi:opacity protein-like surface antigen